MAQVILKKHNRKFPKQALHYSLLGHGCSVEAEVRQSREEFMFWGVVIALKFNINNLHLNYVLTQLLLKPYLGHFARFLPYPAALEVVLFAFGYNY